jgi:SAM-dependent methyltransferase
MIIPEHAVWHDVECSTYDADLPLWHELARAAPSGVLDVGAGTGRVALPLAHAGHTVTALDVDGELLRILEARAAEAGTPVTTIAADAADFALDEPVGLILVPMQTIQLLPERAGFFASARRSLEPGGRLAVAIATDLDSYDGTPPLPPPDLGLADGWTYISQPVAIRVEPTEVRIERIRQRVGPHGERVTTDDEIRLQIITPGGLAEEGAAHGLEAVELRHIPETPQHIATQVVIFRG